MRWVILAETPRTFPARPAAELFRLAERGYPGAPAAPRLGRPWQSSRRGLVLGISGALLSSTSPPLDSGSGAGMTTTLYSAGSHSPPSYPRKETFEQPSCAQPSFPPSFPRRRESRIGGSPLEMLAISATLSPTGGVTQRSPKAGIQGRGTRPSTSEQLLAAPHYHRQSRGVLVAGAGTVAALTLAVHGGELHLAQSQVLGSDLHELVIRNERQRFLEAHPHSGLQAFRDVGR